MSGGSTGYDAFITYSHARDRTLAPALRAGLQRLSKPWYRLRAMRVFLDNASLSANPDLWGSIERALADSRWLVLMASTDAARSVWVNREVEWWLTHRSADRVLIVLTDGEPDPDHEATALPPAMRAAAMTEPRWVDLRWMRDAEPVDRDDPRFRDCVADIASAVRGLPKDDLVGEDVRQHRRTLRLARAAVVSLALLAVLTLIAAVVAFVQRDNARAEARTATARGLASAALANADTRLDLAQLLAVEAYRTDPQPQTRAALFQVLAASPQLERYLHVGAPVTSVTASEDGTVVVAGASDGRVVRWDLTTDTRTATTTGDRPVIDVAVSEDGGEVAVLVEGRALRWDTRSGEPAEVQALDDHNRGSAAISPSGDVVAFITRHVTAGLTRPDEDRLIAHDVRTGRTAESVAVGWPEKVALRSDDLLVVLGSTTWQTRSAGDLAVLRSVDVGIMPADGGFATGFSPDAAHMGWMRNGETYQWRTDVPSADFRSADVELTTGEPNPESVAISRDGGRIAAGHAGVVHVYDTDGDDEGARWRLPGNSLASAITFIDSDRLVSGTDDALVLWDLTRNTRVGTPMRTAVPYTCRACRSPWLVTAPGRVALAGGLDPRLRIESDDGDTGGFVDEDDVEHSFAAPAWTPDQTRLLVPSMPGGAVRVLTGDGSEVVDQWPGLTGVDDVMATRVSSDGTRFLLVDQDGRVHVRDTSDGEVLTVVDTGVDGSLFGVPVAANMAAISSDGDNVALAGADAVSIVDVPAASTRKMSGGSALAVQYTSEHLLVQRTAAVEVWDRHGTTLLRSIPSTGVWTRGVPATEDGRLAARIRADHMMILTDLGSGEEIGAVRLNPADGMPQVIAAAFTGDGRAVVTAEPGGRLTRWHAAEDEWTRIACASAGRDLTDDEWRRHVGTEPPATLACLR
jgi:WD40 repeat protein